MSMIRDQASDRDSFFLVIITGLIAVGIPYGYAAALVVGTLLSLIRPTRAGNG